MDSKAPSDHVQTDPASAELQKIREETHNSIARVRVELMWVELMARAAESQAQGEIGAKQALDGPTDPPTTKV